MVSVAKAKREKSIYMYVVTMSISAFSAIITIQLFHSNLLALRSPALRPEQLLQTSRRNPVL